MILTLKHHFDAAHRLEFHTGLCRNLHGHRWEVEVEIEGWLDRDELLVDFGDIKKIINRFDHSTILKKCSGNEELISVLKKENDEDKLCILDVSPTAENLAYLLRHAITKFLIGLNINFKYVKVTLWESPEASIEDK